MKRLFFLMLFLTIRSFAVEIICPPEINSQQALTSSAPDSWESFDYHPEISHKLQGISVFSGPPKEDADLVPDNSKEPYFWNLPKDNKYGGYWISCTYGSTRLRLIKKIPTDVAKCTYKYKGKHKTGDYLDCK